MMYDTSTQEQIYRDYYDKVFAYTVNRTRSREDAEDLTSEIFIKVYNKLESFDEKKAQLSTWIYQIAKHSVIDYYRRYKLSEELPEEITNDEDLDENLLNEEALSELASALQKLPVEQRDIIINRYYYGHTLQEIAEMMSLSYGVTKLRHKEALFRLRTEMTCADP
jgi:RNA polymerase sigma-70 factor (ECF subfamily)